MTDPRDGTRILYNAARAGRPRDNQPSEEVTTNRVQDVGSENCVVCTGRLTPIVDIAGLSCGFTFISFNLYPMVVPGVPAAAAERASAEHRTPSDDLTPRSEAIPESTAEGLHLLQWTSSVHDQDWETLSRSDRLTVVQRLAALEKRLVEGRRFVTVIKNYGRLVGGSLVHDHQQIAATNVLPARVARNRRYREQYGRTVSSTLMGLMEERQLTLLRLATGTLGVAPWMRRPYEMVYTVHDDGPENLFQLTEVQLQDLGDALAAAIGAMRALFPRLGKEPAYNVVFNTGPGAGIYLEFLPYTQETGGFEHAGLYVCQATPELCHNVYASDILPRRWQ